MDRRALEGYPRRSVRNEDAVMHGSNRRGIYCRAEYPLAVRRLEIAISLLASAGCWYPHHGSVIPLISSKQGAGVLYVVKKRP
jgi:hypothetical protein